MVGPGQPVLDLQPLADPIELFLVVIGLDEAQALGTDFVDRDMEVIVVPVDMAAGQALMAGKANGRAQRLLDGAQSLRRRALARRKRDHKVIGRIALGPDVQLLGRLDYGDDFLGRLQARTVGDPDLAVGLGRVEHVLDEPLEIGRLSLLSVGADRDHSRLAKATISRRSSAWAASISRSSRRISVIDAPWAGRALSHNFSSPPRRP